LWLLTFTRTITLSKAIMAKRITMLTTYASPISILHQGITYSLPDDLADQLLAIGSGQMEGQPAGVVATKGTKVSKPQSPPDPEEHKKADDLDEDDDADE